MISLAHITHGDAVRNTTLSRTLPGALTKAFISEWIQPQLPGTAESQRLGRPRALPLYPMRSEEHTSELQSQSNLVCRLLLEKKKYLKTPNTRPLTSCNMPR